MHYVVNVILDRPLRQSYSYLSPQALSRGTRVMVEFHHRQQLALVASCVVASSFTAYPLEKLSCVLAASDSDSAIPEHIWQLCQFASNYYHHPLGSTLFCAIPVLWRKTLELPDPELPLGYYRLNATAPKVRSRKQQACLEQLSQRALNDRECKQLLGANYLAVLASWLENKLIASCAAPPPATVNQALALNAEQQQIVTTITTQLGTYHPCLIYGITGSGKTEVFLHLLAEILARGHQALILVPEINLTPQLAQRFSARFPYANVRLLSSACSAKQRLNNWCAAAANQAQIILGTRLAVFTPFRHLGIIIVDEEHDDSFKQNDSLRYHARDLAVWRAKELAIPIILASATPALETLYNYKLGKYHLYKLTHRANLNATLPSIKLINLQHYAANFAGISQIAVDKLSECLARKELALIFINRRGYAPIISCYECGWVSSCKNCSSKMVYHHNKQRLQCHHCSYQIVVPRACPNCHNQYLHTIGHGTQKLEQFLSEYFPTAKIKRVDRDTTTTKQAWNELYHAINHNEVDILVGTQMLAKGHDFANLTLVIGLNLDNALYSYDFRASEDMFNTLTQVAGRAGRAAKAGTVLLQTNYPEHPLYKFLINHDFNGFINYTLHQRQQNNLPPFSYYAMLKLSSDSEAKLGQALQQLKKVTQRLPHPQVVILPPVPAVMAKIHNKYRGQMLITTNQRAALHSYLSVLEPHLAAFGVSCAIDVDPFEL